MTVRITTTLFGFLAAIAVTLTSCWRHTHHDDYMAWPVDGDTVSYSPKMDEQLRRDSAEKSDAYYYRMNRVKRVAITDSTTRKIVEIDRFGHELREQMYISGHRYWDDQMVYDQYGQLRYTNNRFFYSNGDYSWQETTLEYEMNDSAQTRRLTRRIDEEYEYEIGEFPHYWTYEYKADRLYTETEWSEGRCESRTFFIYDSLGNKTCARTLYFKEGEGDSSIFYYRYDSLNRETGRAWVKDGELIEDFYREWNADGRVTRYRRIDYLEGTEFTVEYVYSANGLITWQVERSQGKTNIRRYSYSYY